ncbi:MAG: DNA polymerase II large subunit [Thermoproteota archaeon]
MKNNNSVKDEEYTSSLLNSLHECYRLAMEAKSKGIDPEKEVESKIVYSQAEAMEYLVGLPGLAKRMRELVAEVPAAQIPFRLAEEIVYGKFGHLEPEKAALTAIRAALAILTPPGTTAAPMEGIVDVKIKKNEDHSPYLAIYFAAPMRSAGGTEQAVAVLLADFIRRTLKLEKYRATENEVNRFVEELRIYEREVGRFQYRVSDDQIRYVYQNLPVEVTGVQSDKTEVTLYRNLPRVETNKLRGGALRVLNDGIVGRRNKVLKYVSEIGLTGWSWLENVTASARQEKYLGEVIVGRPVLSFSDRFGGFRLRYGRCRNTGLASMGIHPATMIITDNFLAVGTQIRVEKPGKSGTIVPVNSIEPPIVKLLDGSVVRVDSIEKAEQVKEKITSVLFLGDLLISVGEYLENNIPLDKSSYVEEWWSEELNRAISKFDATEVAIKTGVSLYRLQTLIDKPLSEKPSLDEAIKISINLSIPLHPSFLFFWNNVSIEEILYLREILERAKPAQGGGVELHESFTESAKIILEKLCVPHRMNGKVIFIGPEEYKLLRFTLFSRDIPDRLPTSALELVSATSGVEIRDKAATFLGVRMGRPEAAAPRFMDPPIHALFPVGSKGGSNRSIADASTKQLVLVEIASRFCPKCGTTSHFVYCSNCGERTIAIMKCPICGAAVKSERCETCGRKPVPYSRTTIDLAKYLKDALNLLEMSTPPKKLKGVISLVNPERIPENLAKGILRAHFDLSVFRDGTVRFDASNAVLTEFRPREIHTPLDVLKRLGYLKDTKGNDLNDEESLVPLKPQDIIIPLKCAKHLIKLAGFIDELLVKVYGVKPFYNIRQIQDLIGHLIVGLSPHTYGAILGRIIGFTNSEVLFAHPFWHQAKRRDCDGDADSVTLVMDVLLNFSKSYLPDQPGGKMDSPLVILPVVNPTEVEDQVYNLENCSRYPLEFYTLTCSKAHPNDLRNLIQFVGDRIRNGVWAIVSNHFSRQIDGGPLQSSYRKLGSMFEKLTHQMTLSDKLDGIDATVVAERILDSHLLRDLSGNLRAFYTQGVRCKRCGTRFRRVPLIGRCTKCHGELTVLIHNRSVGKYLELVTWLLSRYNLNGYFIQHASLLKLEIDMLREPMERRISEYLFGD